MHNSAMMVKTKQMFVVYKDNNNNGDIWIRDKKEFYDGRFKPIENTQCNNNVNNDDYNAKSILAGATLGTVLYFSSQYICEEYTTK